MPDRKPIKAFKPNSSPQNASPYIEEDAEDVPDKKQFIARGLLLICLMLVSIGAAYDLGTKLAASPKVGADLRRFIEYACTLYVHAMRPPPCVCLRRGSIVL